MTKHIQWDGTLSQEGYDILKGEAVVLFALQKSVYHHD